MGRSVSAPNFGNSTRSFNNYTPRKYRDWDAPSQFISGRPQTHSERSSDSGTSLGSRSDRSMNHGSGGYRGRGGRGRGGSSGARGGRKYSSSSGSSNSQHRRPVLRQSPALRGRVTSPVQRAQEATRLDSPVTPTKEQSSFTLSSNNISEIYTPSRSANILSPRSRASPSTPTRNNYGRNTPPYQHPVQKPITRNGNLNWAYQQECKIKLLGMPKTCWTKQVFKTISQYGAVMRIEMQQGSLVNNAWVTLQ
jgi:RNA-dependent RNA polymerase